MTETPGSTQPPAWRVPQCPFSIEYSPSVLDEIRLAVVDAFFSVPRGGAEIGGVLFGTHEEGRVHILAFRPLVCEHAFGPSFTLSERDHARLAELIQEAGVDPTLKGLAAVGWYHSHTRSGIFLSDIDLGIHDRYFTEPWQVALVLRPDGMKPTRAGFFFREGDGSIHSAASYREFVVSPGSHANGDGAPPVRPSGGGTTITWRPAAPPPPLPPEPQVPAPPKPLETPPPLPRPDLLLGPEEVPPELPLTPSEYPPPPFGGGPETRVRRSRTWAMLALALATAGAAYLSRGVWMKAVSDKPLALHLQALDTNGQLRIQWDRDSISRADPVRGVLEITDGGTKLAIPLDPQRLRAGSFQYARGTGMVEAHLVVECARSRPLEEFTSFIGQPAAQAAPPPAPAPAEQAHQGPQQAAAAADAEQARADLKKQELRTLQLERSLAQMQDLLRREQERKRGEAQNPNANPASASSAPPQSAASHPQPPPSLPKPQPAPSTATNTSPPAASPAPGPPKPVQTEHPAPPMQTPPAGAKPVATAATTAPAQRPASPSPPSPIPSHPAAPPASAPAPVAAWCLGHWVTSAASRSGSPYPPESVTLIISETNGRIRGSFVGRYKAPNSRKFNPQVNFGFEGTLRNGQAKFPFVSAGGMRGEIELIRLPGKQDAIEVVWYSDRDKLTFDDLFFRAR